MKNKVIVIGSDHVNTLGVIRCFGENGILPYAIIKSDTDFAATAKSKYIKKSYICKSYDDALNLLDSEFKDESNKAVIIPVDDKVVSLLDDNYNKLKSKFILHNINDKQSEIVKYMDKYNQFLLAKKYKLKTAYSKIIDLYIDDFEFDIFPCIIKPLASFNGKKDDITICNDKCEFENVLVNFKNKNYKKLLVQEVIDFDYEGDISGFCYNKKVSIPGYIYKKRIYPVGRGSFTFGKVKNISKIGKELKKIESILSDLDYYGIFDIDFFIKDNEFYLNEINFRNGALGYLYGDAYISYYWYLSCVNNKFISSNEIKEDYYVIADYGDIHNVIDKNITIKEYIYSLKKSRIKLTGNKKDRKPSWYFIINKIRKKLVGD